MRVSSGSAASEPHEPDKPVEKVDAHAPSSSDDRDERHIATFSGWLKGVRFGLRGDYTVTFGGEFKEHDAIHALAPFNGSALEIEVRRAPR